MSLEFTEDIIIKEEYDIQDSDFPNRCGLGEHIHDGHPLANDQTPFSNATQDYLPPIKTEPLDKNEDDSKTFAPTAFREIQLPKTETLGPNIFQYNISPLKSEPPGEDDFVPHNGEDTKEPISFIEEASYECSDQIDHGVRAYNLIGDNDHQTQDESYIETRDQSDRSVQTFCCYSCGTIFTKYRTYHTHYKNRHPDMIITKEDELQGPCNQMSFVPKVPEIMLCKYCLKTFNGPETYHGHMTNAHRDRLFTCPYCEQTFREKIRRAYHIDAHEGKTPYKCPQCPKMFSDPYKQREHTKTHLSIKPFACAFCDYTCIRKLLLGRHEVIHTTETPYDCKECDLKFRDEKLLDIHMRKHMNIRNFKCPECDKAFTCARYLKSHLKRHRTDRPFSCQSCDKTFSDKRYLNNHQLMHSAKKKFECKLCGRILKQQKSLVEHYRYVHESSLIKE